MTGTRTIDLSGAYIVASVNSTDLVLTDASTINPNWAYVDFDGSGTTGYTQNISMLVPPVDTPVDLSGSYTVSGVTATHLTLASPGSVTTDWGFLADFPGAATALTDAFVSSTNGNWIGPFIVEDPDTTLLVANFLAASGLYKDNGKKQTAFPIALQVEATPVNLADVPIGAAQTFSTTVPGNSSGRDLRAMTLVCELTIPGRQSVRARRVTNADYNYQGTVVDEVKWQDLYGVGPVPLSHFGNVTTVHTRTYATEGALAVKQRKLNMLATRLVPIRTVGTTFSAAAPTRDAANIFTAACLDPFIGGRTLAELDLDSIYSAVASAIAYFGSTKAGEFSYTFDDDSTSFEETGATIAAAAFCTAYRQGSLIRLALEEATENSAMLFNHRNKIPGSETRTVRFGNLDDNDGVEIDYVNPVDDTAATFYLPTDRSATKPRQVKANGVRTFEQAYWTAWRTWNKIRYQNVGVQFNALQEAALVARNTRVLVADNTRPETQDGEIYSQASLQLQTSQPVAFVGGVAYTIFLQLPDGTIDSMTVSAGSDDHHVVIARAPRVALIFGVDQYALPTYQIVRNDSPRTDAFLITDRQGDNNFLFQMQAVNYSPLYYANEGLLVWLDFQVGYEDAGPFLHDAATATAAIVTDGVRGLVHHGTGQFITLPAFNAPASYTKAAWVKGGFGNIFSTPAVAGYESMHFESGQLYFSHAGGGSSNVLWPDDGTWHHAAVTYDAAAGLLAAYVDGVQKGTVASAQRTLAPIAASEYVGAYGFIGYLDDMRLYQRAFAPAEVLALYRSTKL